MFTTPYYGQGLLLSCGIIFLSRGQCSARIIPDGGKAEAEAPRFPRMAMIVNAASTILIAFSRFGAILLWTRLRRLRRSWEAEGSVGGAAGLGSVCSLIGALGVVGVLGSMCSLSARRIFWGLGSMGSLGAFRAFRGLGSVGSLSA